jgi:hypothetical protein
MSSPLELKQAFIEMRTKFHRQEVDLTTVYAAADAYIESIKEFKKQRKDKKLFVPDRTKLMRTSF